VVDLARARAVRLRSRVIWNRNEKVLLVIAYDGLTGEEIVVPVSGDEAVEVYQHPFAYSSRAIKPPGLGEG
jgi:hypothetical protein